MRKTTAANISVILALLLWPVAMPGFGFALGDPSPGVSESQIRLTKLIGVDVLLSLTFVFLVAAAWLAGYSYTEVKTRSIVSTLSCVLFVIVVAMLFLKDAL